MADLSTFAQTVSNLGVTIAVLPTNNFRAAPLSSYSTRQLEFFSIAITGIETDYLLSNSLFARVTKGIQSIAQVAIIGVPDAGAVVIAVEADTNPTTGPAFDNDPTPTKSERMKASVDASTAGNSTVVALSLIGATLA
jgi:hypothetical protein